jgi:NADH dehydrogenase [ubiquinone] 1 alpha subcomplex assembly factor 5
MQRFSLRTLRSPSLIRSFASVGAPPPQATTPFEVFDRQAKRRQKDRAAVRGDGAQSRVTDYLRAEVADRMLERFEVSGILCC